MCALRGRTIQSSIHLIHTIIEGVKDYKRVALINLDQSKAFKSIEHKFAGVKGVVFFVASRGKNGAVDDAKGGNLAG